MMVQRLFAVLLMLVVVFVGCGEDEEEVELSVENLIIQLGDSDSYVALKASEKLVEIGEAAVPELIKVLTLPDMRGRQKLALQALQKIGAPSVQQLIPLLENPLVRSQVTEVLSAIGTSEALQAIQATKTKEIIWEKDGAKMVLIPAGSFEMGSNNGGSSEKPVHTVELDAFYMDIHEVTVLKFREFVRDADYHGYNPGGFSVARYSPTDDHPMIYLSWFDATAYAKWAGKRLPTEAEWEYAARGGLVGKEFPWGDDEAVARDYAGFFIRGKDVWDYSQAPVGSFKPNGYGLYDMAGNVYEWCADWFDSDYHSKSPSRNPQGPDKGQSFDRGGPYRVLRSGGWVDVDDLDGLRVSRRGASEPASSGDNFGFRCVSEFPVAQQ